MRLGFKVQGFLVTLIKHLGSYAGVVLTPREVLYNRAVRAAHVQEAPCSTTLILRYTCICSSH